MLQLLLLLRVMLQLMMMLCGVTADDDAAGGNVAADDDVTPADIQFSISYPFSRYSVAALFSRILPRMDVNNAKLSHLSSCFM